jgi:hypothetical protein
LLRNKLKALALHEGSPQRGPNLRHLPKVNEEFRRVKEHFEAAGATITVMNDTSAHPAVPGVMESL